MSGWLLPKSLLRWCVRVIGWAFAALTLLVLIFGFFNLPFTPYIASERARLGEIRQDWVRLEEINPHLRRAVLAAEDASFCAHWGFDIDALRAAIADGARRGGSTITQQTVKNVFLWQGRSWIRKGLEAGITPLVELIWPKHRILEVYLNVAEFDEGVFGAQAASQWYFGIDASDLSLAQASGLASVLPNPKERSARAPGNRGVRIADGAQTLARDGRAACIED
ncbi:MAG: monofunctional biosynthetic peptidoglycan transglycosylase [Dinoroseobacter sp.]|nr:monofunctional biosynthetic peptidoglycan transglycosylase [Dinoroseobacter sp.]